MLPPPQPVPLPAQCLLLCSWPPAALVAPRLSHSLLAELGRGTAACTISQARFHGLTVGSILKVTQAVLVATPRQVAVQPELEYLR